MYRDGTAGGERQLLDSLINVSLDWGIGGAGADLLLSGSVVAVIVLVVLMALRSLDS